MFNTVADAVDEGGREHDRSSSSRRASPPTRSTRPSTRASRTVICITEHVPVHEMLRAYTYFRPKGITMIGPNCPGVLSPGKANVGIIPAEIFSEGAVGLVSRSGTLTYQIGHELTQLGLGNSTIVGIGGDPVVGSSFIDVLAKFEDDPQTELIVMVGEIGGDEEEKAAAFISEHVTKPVLSYIAGFSAPPGKTMGHAGAIISGSSGTAQAKKEALEARGIQVGTTPTEVAAARRRPHEVALDGPYESALPSDPCGATSSRWPWRRPRSDRCRDRRARRRATRRGRRSGTTRSSTRYTDASVVHAAGQGLHARLEGSARRPDRRLAARRAGAEPGARRVRRDRRRERLRDRADGTRALAEVDRDGRRERQLRHATA